MESARTGLVFLCVMALVGCVRDEEALDDPGGNSGGGNPSTLTVTAPADIQQEASAAQSTVTLGQATSGGGDGQVSISNDAPNDFSLGQTTVTWTATDASNNQATDVQMVSLADTTPPMLSAPANVVANQTATLTPVTLGNAIATDVVDSAPAMQNDAPAPGFPVGVTTVTWTATDASSNASTAMQLVTINAMTPGSNLSITAPSNVQQEATGPATMVALGQPTVTGGVGNVSVSHDAPAGGFLLGATVVTWTATDDNNVTAMAAQMVTVADTTAPSITAPQDVVVDQNGDPTPVSLGTPTVADLADVNPTTSNDAPAAGFPLGTTVVTWTVTDAANNSAMATQNVTVNLVAAACSTHEPEFANTVYPILDSAARCQGCHTPPNTVTTANLFNLLANDTTGFELFQAIAGFESGGQSNMLVKPLGGAGHGGGNRFPIDGANDAEYMAIEALVNKLAICVPDVPPPAQGAQLGSNYEQLYKVTMSLASRVPTVAETAQVEAAADEAALTAALVNVLDSLMTEEAFYDRAKEIYNDLMLTDADADDRGGPENNFDLREFANEDYYDAFDGDRREDANYGLARAPVELIEYVLKQDLPFTEIMTADYTMVNPYSAVLFGVDTGDPNFPFSSDTNPANHDREDFRPALTLTQADGDQVPMAGVIGTHAFLARIPSTNTNVNRARARWSFYYFLGVDIEGLAPRDGLDLDNVIGDVPTMEDPQCTVCHNIMDPVAGLFKNRANDGRYSGDVTWHHERFTNGVQRMLDPGYTMNPADALPAAEEPRALPWFTMRVAQDDRFAQTTVRTVFTGLTGIEVTDAATTTFINGLKDDFVANNYDFKSLVQAVSTSPYMLARNLASIESPSNFADIGSGTMLKPEQLARKIDSVMGGNYTWEGPNSGSGLLGRHELLYGGIDSRDIVVRTTDPNAMINGIQQRIANQMACERVADDLLNSGILFPNASVSDVPTDPTGATRIQENIQFLHRHLLGEELAIDDPEVLATYQLFQDVRAQGDTAIPSDCRGGGGATDTDGTVLPWMAVVTYLLSDFSFLYQ